MVTKRITSADLHRLIEEYHHENKRGLKEVQEQIDHLHKHARALKTEVIHSRTAEAHDTDELKKGLAKLMALTSSEQAQLDRIADAIEAIATETAGTAQKILDLMAQHGVDQATIDGMEADVVGALSTVADRAEALANDLKDPATPLTPTP